MKTCLLIVGSSLLALLSSSSLRVAGEEPDPIAISISTSNNIPSDFGSVAEYIGSGCTGYYGESTDYQDLPRNTCVGDHATGGSVRLSGCGSGLAPTFKRWSNTLTCQGDAVVEFTGTVPTTYAPMTESTCLSNRVGVNSTATALITCANPEDSYVRRFVYTDAACTVREDITNYPSANSDVPLSGPDACDTSNRDSRSYRSFVDSTRSYEYRYSKPNCSISNFYSVGTELLNTCTEYQTMIYNSTTYSSSMVTRFSKLIAPTDASLRGPAPPTSWPPLPENQLVFHYECAVDDCSRGCVVRGATKLAACVSSSEQLPIYPAVEWESHLCTADTKYVAQATYTDATCSASKISSLEFEHASNKCHRGSYSNCGGGQGVAESGRVPTTLPALVEVEFEFENCTGKIEELEYQTVDTCFAHNYYGEGPPVIYTKWSIANNTATRVTRQPQSGSVSQTCAGDEMFSPNSYPMNVCEYGSMWLSTAQAQTAGVAIDTTTVSNGVTPTGEPGAGSGASAVATTSISALFLLAIASACAQLL